MSEWQPQIVKVEKVEKHPNADALSIATVLGNYPVITKLDQYKEGQLVSYIPIDSVVDTNHPSFSFLEKPRIRARKLRGIYSQGLLVDVPDENLVEGDSVVDIFGLKKYVYVEELEDILGLDDETKKYYHIPNYNIGQTKPKGRNALPPPTGWAAPYYDLESFRKHYKRFEIGEEIVVSEKIEGCVTGDTLVSTLEYGEIPISEIVINRLNCMVKSYNHALNKEEYCKVKEFSKLQSNNNWYEITSEHGTVIKITGEHLVFSFNQNSYIQVKNLTENDEILFD